MRIKVTKQNVNMTTYSLLEMSNWEIKLLCVWVARRKLDVPAQWYLVQCSSAC